MVGLHVLLHDPLPQADGGGVDGRAPDVDEAALYSCTRLSGMFWIKMRGHSRVYLNLEGVEIRNLIPPLARPQDSHQTGSGSELRKTRKHLRFAGRLKRKKLKMKNEEMEMTTWKNMKAYCVELRGNLHHLMRRRPQGKKDAMDSQSRRVEGATTSQSSI